MERILRWIRDGLDPDKDTVLPPTLAEKLEENTAVIHMDMAHIPETLREEFREGPGDFKMCDLIACMGLACTLTAMTFARPVGEPVKEKLVRISGFTQLKKLKQVKADLVGTYITVKGNVGRSSVLTAVVVRVSSVKPLVTQMKFTCPMCTTKQHFVFADGKFRADSGRVPRTIECELTCDLVDIIVPGDIVSVSGIVKVLSTEEARSRGKGAQTGQMYYLYLDVNHLSKISTANSDSTESSQTSGPSSSPSLGLAKDFIEFTPEDLQGIRQIMDWKGSVFSLLVHSVCPAIYGHLTVKAGLLLTLFGGRRRDSEGKGKLSIRSDPHILIVGDPGLGKSQLLMATVKLAPRGVYISGNLATTAGLTVTVCKDVDTGETALEAGALVLSDQGACCIDEFDKMTEHQALLEAMEQQSISIAKAGMVCTLPARASIIAAANPVGGHYSKAKTVAENLKMNSALLSRFDLVYILLDKPDENMDRFLSDHIMKVHSSKGAKRGFPLPGIGSAVQDAPEQSSTETLKHRLATDKEAQQDPIPARLLRLFISYARTYVQPRLSSEAAQLLQEFYLKLRHSYRSIDATPITTRQLESMIRLSEARARSELRSVVTEADARDIIEIMMDSLWKRDDEAAAPAPTEAASQRSS
ncbi:DNA replication licensing factor mcm8, partial [Kappamyces sp. JEL0680]